jgi:hypothetical protein
MEFKVQHCTKTVGAMLLPAVSTATATNTADIQLQLSTAITVATYQNTLSKWRLASGI